MDLGPNIQPPPRLRRRFAPEHATLRPRTELSREKDVYKYLNAWANLYRPTALYRHAFPSRDQALPEPEPCGDTALTSIAQLCALRLGARRCLISLISSGVEYVLAEATRTMSMQYDTFEDPKDHPWIGSCSFPRSDGLNDLAIDHWRKARHLREPPETADAYYTQGFSPHFMVVSDAKYNDDYNDRAFVNRSASLRFFCSIPLRDANGTVLGALSILDDTPRYGISVAELLFLEDSADTITSQLDTSVVRSRQQSSERLIQGLGLFNNNKSSLREWWIGQDNDRLRRGGRHQPENEQSENREARLDHEFGIQGGHDRTIAALRRARREGSPETSQAEDSPPISMSQTTETNLNAENAREKQQVSSTDFSRSSQDSGTSSSDHVKPTHQAQNSYTTSDDTIHKKDRSQDFDIAKRTSHAYARASNLICEGMRAEGVVFVDARSASVTLERPTSGQPTASSGDVTSSSHSDTGPSGVDEENLSDHAAAKKLCRIAGFATRNSSSLHGSKAFSSRRMALQEADLQRYIKRYRRGKVFNFSVDNDGIYSSSGDDPATASSEEVSRRTDSTGPRKTRASRDAAQLGKIMNGAQTIAFLPIWNDASDSYSSCVFVWSTTPLRFFDAVEDLPYIAAFSHSLTAEIARLEAIVSDRAKSNFISSVSHELRSPLHGVLAGAELLQDTELSPFQQDMISTVTMAGRALLDTVNHILDYAKISSRPKVEKRKSRVSQRGALRSVTVDLASLTENVVETVVSAHRFQHSLMPTSTGDTNTSLTGSHQSKNFASFNNSEVAIVLNIQKQASWVTDIARGSLVSLLAWWTSTIEAAMVELVLKPFPPNYIRESLLTLLKGNSLKYTKTGVINVTLSATPVDQHNATIELVVQDSGIGMTEQFLTNELFVPYKQANQHSIGTGLGLSIVKEIARELNARIDVQSTLGKGTRVSLFMDIGIMEPNLEDIDRPDSQLMEMATNLRFQEFHLLTRDASSTHNFSLGSHATTKSVADMASTWLNCSVSSGPTRDGASKHGVCAIAEPDLVYLAKSDPERLATMTSELAASNVPLIVLSCSLQSTLSGITIEDFPIQPAFVFQPIGPRKLLRVLTKNEKSPTLSPSSSLYDTTSDLTAPLLLRRKGDSSADEKSFPWNSDATNQGPSGRNTIATKAAARHKAASSAARRQKQISTSVASNTTSTGPQDSESNSESKTATGAAEGSTVLLVEDNPINMRLLKVLMQKLNVPFDTAENGAEALALFVAEPARYMLIITDISMPIMDGNEATAKIREFERRHKLPKTMIVAVTGVTSAAQRSKSLDSGVDLYFTKPVKMKEISALLDEI